MLQKKNLNKNRNITKNNKQVYYKLLQVLG